MIPKVTINILIKIMERRKLFTQITRYVHFKRLCISITFVKMPYGICLIDLTEYLIKIHLGSIMINELKASLIEIQSDCIFILNMMP